MGHRWCPTGPVNRMGRLASAHRSRWCFVALPAGWLPIRVDCRPDLVHIDHANDADAESAGENCPHQLGRILSGQPVRAVAHPYAGGSTMPVPPTLIASPTVLLGLSTNFISGPARILLPSGPKYATPNARKRRNEETKKRRKEGPMWIVADGLRPRPCRRSLASWSGMPLSDPTDCPQNRMSRRMSHTAFSIGRSWPLWTTQSRPYARRGSHPADRLSSGPDTVTNIISARALARPTTALRPWRWSTFPDPGPRQVGPVGVNLGPRTSLN